MIWIICAVAVAVIAAAFAVRYARRKARQKAIEKERLEHCIPDNFTIPVALDDGSDYVAMASCNPGRSSYGDSETKTCRMPPQTQSQASFSQRAMCCTEQPSYQENNDKISVSQVQFSAVVPKKINKGEYASIDISVYEEEYREIVERMIQNRDDEAKEITGSSKTVKKGTDVKIVLSSPDIEISDCEETQTWQGKYLTYNFIAEIPEDFGKKQILFVASVYFNGLIATKLKFIASCAEENPGKITPLRNDISTAFVSYSSRDRIYVSTLIQGMRKARPELDIFCDIEKLHSGDDWEKTLFQEIEKRDILFLCWSQNAKNSHEVEKEWRYALDTKGLDGIDPIPLVSPIECPPPEELKSKHFNDVTLLYRNI